MSDDTNNVDKSISFPSCFVSVFPVVFLSHKHYVLQTFTVTYTINILPLYKNISKIDYVDQTVTENSIQIKMT